MNWQDIPGHSCSIETIYGPAVAEAKDGDTLVELGVYHGRSLAMLGHMARDAGKDLHIVGVDLFEEAGAITRTAGPHAYEPATLAACMANLNATDAKVRLMVGDTADTASEFGAGTLALVFIDGDHSYEGCKRDIEAWLPKVKPGGLLAGHDFSGEYPGVMQAVKEAFPDYVHHGGPLGDTGICFYWRVAR